MPVYVHGSAADAWGSRGRRFKSCQPDKGIIAGQRPFPKVHEDHRKRPRPVCVANNVAKWCARPALRLGSAALSKAATWAGER